MMHWEHGSSGGSGTAAVAPVVPRRCTATLRDFAQRRKAGNVGTNSEVLKVLEQLLETRICPGVAAAGMSTESGQGQLRLDQTHMLQLLVL